MVPGGSSVKNLPPLRGHKGENMEKKMTPAEKLAADKKAAAQWMADFNKKEVEKAKKIQAEIKKYGRDYGDQ
jgi:hypothetical protein